jgi:hypothetical protein
VATTVNKLVGTLTIGTGTPQSIEAQVSKVGTPQTVTRDSPVTVLTGDVVQVAATYSWSLSGEMLLDLSNKTGAYYALRALQGTTQTFTFKPTGTTGPTITGSCIIDGFNTEELNAGALISSKFAWPVQGQITVTPPP